MNLKRVVMILKILKKKIKISQLLCKHGEIEMYYHCNNGRYKNGRIKCGIVYDVYKVIRCCECRKILYKEKVAVGSNANQLYYKFDIII